MAKKKKGWEALENDINNGNFQYTYVNKDDDGYNRLGWEALENDLKTGNLKTINDISKNDLAPINTLKPKNQDNWFNSGALEDGFTIGNTVKTILGTAGDFTTGFANGALNVTEGIGDLIGYGIAGVVEATGNKKLAKNLREEYNKNLYDEWFKPSRDIINESDLSILGDKADNISKMAGGIGLNIALGGVGQSAGMGAKGITALTSATNGISSAGSSMGEAYRNGATNEQAALYGTISGASSALVNMLVGGYGNSVSATGISKGIGRLDDKFATLLTKKIENQIIKNFAEMGIKAVGEGGENVLTGLIDIVGKKMTYMPKKEWGQLLKDEDLLGQFVQGSITSAVMQTPSLYRSTKAGRDFVTGFTKNEQLVYDKEVEKRINELNKNNDKVTNKQIKKVYKQVREDLQKGYISTDTIEEALGGERYNQYKRITEKRNNLQNQIEKLKSKINTDAKILSNDYSNGAFKEFGKVNLADRNKLEDLQSQLTDTENKISKIKGYLNDEVSSNTKSDNMLRESYNEKERKRQRFQVDLDSYDGKEKELYSKAMESGVLNNTRRTHEYIEMLAKISKDKGLDFDFTNNAKLQKSDLSLKYDIGGYNNGESINTNIDSNKALNVIAGHEILHSFENSEGYDTLKKAVTDYAKTKGDYQKVYDKMSELYKDVNGADIDNEVTSELIGNYLFTDKDFIDNLSAKDRNIFRKAFDEVKYLSKVATAGSKEKRQLEKVKHIFDDVYKSKISDYDKNAYVEVQNAKDNVTNIQKEKMSQNAKKMVNTYEEYDPFEAFGKENRTGLTDDEIAPLNTKYSLANKDKIEYNNSTLFTQMMQKVKPDYEGHLVLNDSKNYYLVNKDLNNNFEVLDKIEINDSNKSFIDEMIKEWDYDSGRKSNNDIIEKSQFRKGYSSSNYSYDEENETWFEYAGRILEGDKSENNNSKRNIREGSPNSETRELDNSSFSNDKIPIKKTNDLNEYIADVSSREAQQLFKDKQSAKEMITSYLDENDIKNPTMKDINNAYESYDEMDTVGWGTDEAKRARKIFDEVAKEVYNERNKGLDNSSFSLRQKYDDISTERKKLQNELKKLNQQRKEIQEKIPNYNMFKKYDELEEIDKLIAENTEKSKKLSFGQDKIQEQLDEIATPKQKLESESYPSDSLPKLKKGYVRLYRGLNEEYNPNYDRSKLDSPNGYDTLTDNYDLAKQYGKNVYFIDVPKKQVANEIMDNNGVRNFAYKDDKPAGLNGVSGDEYLLNTHHGDFDANNYHKINHSDDTEINTKYSLSKSMPTQDNRGRTLSKEQQNYFKNSQIVDDNGKLMEVYHGTNSDDFNIFDENYIGNANDEGWYGRGFYFATNEGEAKSYGNNVKKAYLNIKNPFNFGEEMQSYDGQKSGDVNYDFGSFMLNLDEKFPEIAKKENITYANYDKNGKLIPQKMSLSKLAKEIKEVYDSPNLKISEYNDNGTTKYGYTYGKNIEDYKIPNKIKNTIKDNGIYNINDAQFAKDNPQYYPHMTSKDIDGVLNYYKKNDVDFNTYHSIYTTSNIDSLKNNRLSEATYYVTREQNKYVDMHIPEEYMKSFGGEMTNIIKSKGYDGIIQSSNGDEIVAFYPEQIKNVDNTNPTDNPDIRYSKGNDDIAPIGNYNVYGEDVKIEEDIAPVRNELGYTPKNPTREDSYDFKSTKDTGDKVLNSELDRIEKRINDRETAKQNRQMVVSSEKTPWRKAKDTFKRLFTNSNVELDNLATESNNQNIKTKADMLNNVYAEAQSNITNAQTDNQGKAIGKSINQLFAPAKESGLEDAFNDYLIHYSNIDRQEHGIGSTVPLNVSQQLVHDYEKEYPEFKEWGKDVWQYGKNAKNNLRDAGLISQELSDKLEDMYPHYVPYIVDKNDLSNYIDDIGEVKPRGVIKRGKGGAYNMLPVEQALTKYTYAQKNSVRQNELYSEVVNTLYDDKNPINLTLDNEDPSNVKGNLYRDNKGSYLTAFVDGKEKSVKISDDLYKTLNRDTENYIKDLENNFEILTKPLQKISRFRRNLLTKYSPTFPVKNALKDVQDATFNSKYTKDFMKNYPSAFSELKDNNNELANQFKSLYGSGNLMGEYDVDSGLYDGNIKGDSKLGKLARVNDIIELAPRYAEFKASIENGASLEEAMYNAREVTTNFSRGGVITKFLNRNGFTFLNANVQGASKFVRNLKGENGAGGIVNSVAKATAFGVAPALFNDLMFGNGEDKDKDYEALPNYIKDNYYLIKTDGNNFIRIPKGRSLSVFGSFARRGLEYMDGDTEAFNGFLENVNNQIGISNPEENNILAPIKQAYGSENGTAWYGGDLVPTRLQKKPKAEQYDETTDEFSKWLGDKLKASPYKINYLLDQYSGGIGDILLPMITQEATSEDDSVTGRLIAPVKDQFVVDSTSDNKYVGKFYETNDKIAVQANSYNATDDDLLKKKYMGSVTSELNKLYAERREIQNDTTMSRSERFKKSQEIKNEINKLSKEGLDTYNNVDRVDNYAVIGDREYYKNTKNEWTKVSDSELEKLQSFGLTTIEKSSYITSKNTISSITKNYKDILANASDEEKSVLNSRKKREIVNVIKSSNLTNDAKAYLYDKSYGDTDTLNALITLGMNMNSYMDFDSKLFESDKYANGKTVPNSKKNKIFKYINSMNIPYEQKLILAKLKYSSYDTNNYEIIQYLNNSDLDYGTQVKLLKKMGFTVYDDGRITWK